MYVSAVNNKAYDIKGVGLPNRYTIDYLESQPANAALKEGRGRRGSGE